MRNALNTRTLRRLDIQGFETVDQQRLAQVAPWQRLAFGLWALLAGVGTVMASPGTLLVLAPIAAFGAANPVHPFDLIYNHGIRRLTHTPELPGRGAPARFACTVGAVGLVAAAWAFSSGHPSFGYALGSILTALAVLVSTTDICIPSMIYRSMFGWPQPRQQTRRVVLSAERVSVASFPG